MRNKKKAFWTNKQAKRQETKITNRSVYTLYSYHKYHQMNSVLLNKLSVNVGSIEVNKFGDHNKTEQSKEQIPA